MTKSLRLKALLANGYFPEELPPPFHTLDFAKFRASIGAAWANQPHYPKTVPEIYSIPKLGSWRRDLSLVNPIAQYHVAKLIADNWVEIRNSISNNYGVDIIKIDQTGDRAVPRPDFTLVSLKHLEISALYDYVLIADVSRFYGTLYTHAVPWGLHGKTWCKAVLNTPAYANCLGAKIDQAVRKGNDNQTLGIPVGPDTSRIVSEIVISAIDSRLRISLNLDENSAARHVDDWYIGFDSLGDADSAITTLSAACREFELEIHPEKTRCAHVPKEATPIWPTAMQELKFGSTQRSQRKRIDYFFAQAFHFSSMYPSDNVLGFAISRSKTMQVRSEDWYTYETYLLKAVRANPTTLPSVVQILASYNASGYQLNKPRISKLVSDILRKCAARAQHAEVAWALFLSKALRIILPSDWLTAVTKLESPVCALLTLDLRSRGLVDGPLDTNLWEQSMNHEGLTSSNWLLAYEADLKGWLAGPNPGYVQAHPFFAELRQRNVSFYDDSKNVTHIRATKPKPWSDALIRFLEARRPDQAHALGAINEWRGLFRQFGGYGAY